MQDIRWGTFALLPHEYAPDEPQERSNSFERMIVDAIRTVARPR